MEQKLMELLLEVAPGIDPKEVKMESRLRFIRQTRASPSDQ